MSDRRSLVIIKGEVKNNVSDYDDSSLYTVDVFFGNAKKYTYKKDNVQILTDPVKVDPDDLMQTYTYLPRSYPVRPHSWFRAGYRHP